MSTTRYGAHRTLRAVNFVCNAPQAQTVSLVGDFNEWNPAANPMKKMPDGAWFLTMELRHGHHRYAFLVDGHLTLDPRAGITRNDAGERVSLVGQLKGLRKWNGLGCSSRLSMNRSPCPPPAGERVASRRVRGFGPRPDARPKLRSKLTREPSFGEGGFAREYPAGAVQAALNNAEKFPGPLRPRLRRQSCGNRENRHQTGTTWNPRMALEASGGWPC
jgi:hypothetical protein